MKIRFCKGEGNKTLKLNVAEGTTVADLLAQQGVELREGHAVVLNNRQRLGANDLANTKLEDGTVVVISGQPSNG